MNPTQTPEAAQLTEIEPVETSRGSEPEAPDFARSCRRFLKDEDGQSMVEFIVIMPILLFLIMGIVQFMLMANVSYFLHYGNFMAMRTASARWEMSVVGKPGQGGQITKIPNAVIQEAERTLRYCLLPVAYIRGDKLNSLLLLSMTAKVRMALDAPNNNTPADWIQAYSEYRYPLYIPLAKDVIYAISLGRKSSTTKWWESLPYDDNLEVFGFTIPNMDPWKLLLDLKTLEFKTNSGRKGQGPHKNQYPHRELIQRRW